MEILRVSPHRNLVYFLILAERQGLLTHQESITIYQRKSERLGRQRLVKESGHGHQ